MFHITETGAATVRVGLLCYCHLFSKPGNVREFDSCQGNVRYLIKSQGSVREKILSGKSGLKLYIVSCIFASILDFAEFVHFYFGFRS